VWAGAQVDDVADTNARLGKRLLDTVDGELGETPRLARTRRPDLDQLARDALLALASDWAFMVSKDSAAGYARERVAGHVDAFDDLADAVRRGARGVGGTRTARAVAGRQRIVDGPFAHMDARLLARTDRV
jgi:1,4-alpha-glucan branching enzyme